MQSASLQMVRGDKMSSEETTTPEAQLKVDAEMGKKLYSIRAKFYDKYNVKRDVDHDIEELIFSKLDELQTQPNALKASEVKELQKVCHIYVKDTVDNILKLEDYFYPKVVENKDKTIYVFEKLGKENDSLKKPLSKQRIEEIIYKEYIKYLPRRSSKDTAEAIYKEINAQSEQTAQ